MRLNLLLMSVALVVGQASGLATARASDEAAVESRIATRVFFLQRMSAREAITLLRSQALVRQVASIGDHGAIVVAGSAETIGTCDTLLRERDAVLRVADPHEPVALAWPAEAPLATRQFSVTVDGMKSVVVLLRSIYRIRELEESAEGEAVTVHAPPPVLDAIGAMLRELELLQQA